MPTYAYQCSQCGHEFEEFQQMSAEPLVTCPKCSKDGLVRIMGTGSGLIFKGSGFYKTDYKKESGKKPEKSTEKKDPPKEGSTTSTPETPKKE